MVYHGIRNKLRFIFSSIITSSDEIMLDLFSIQIDICEFLNDFIAKKHPLSDLTTVITVLAAVQVHIVFSKYF